MSPDTSGKWLLDSRACVEFVSTVSAAGHLLRAAVQLRPRPWELDAPGSTSGHAAATGRVHKEQHFSTPALGSCSKQSLRKSWLPGL